MGNNKKSTGKQPRKVLEITSKVLENNQKSTGKLPEKYWETTRKMSSYSS